MDDSKIVKLLFERSEQAITELSVKYGAACARIAENILGTACDAEECVNDAYLAVWNTVPPQNPDPLSSYLFRITRNTALKRYRANTAKKRNSHFDIALDELAECVPAAGTVEEEFAANELSRLINEFLAGLDKQSRALFVRRFWYGDGIALLARDFGISEHNVSVRISRIKAKLKRFLTKEGVTF